MLTGCTTSRKSVLIARIDAYRPLGSVLRVKVSSCPTILQRRTRSSITNAVPSLRATGRAQHTSSLSESPHSLSLSRLYVLTCPGRFHCCLCCLTEKHRVAVLPERCTQWHVLSGLFSSWLAPRKQPLASAPRPNRVVRHFAPPCRFRYCHPTASLKEIAMLWKRETLCAGRRSTSLSLST